MVCGVVRVRARTHHAPAVAPHQEDAVVQDGAARAAASLQDGRLQDVPLVRLGVVALHQHHVQVGEACPRCRRNMRCEQRAVHQCGRHAGD